MFMKKLILLNQWAKKFGNEKLYTRQQLADEAAQNITYEDTESVGTTTTPEKVVIDVWTKILAISTFVICVINLMFVLKWHIYTMQLKRDILSGDILNGLL